MRELIDCHVHTAACGHASGSVREVVDAAVASGLSGIVLTEHLPLPDALNPGDTFAPSAERFLEYARDVRAVAGDHPELDVVLGAEADWLPHRPEAMAAQAGIAAEAGVDVVLGSVHFLGDWPFDSPDHLAEWDVRGVDRTWRDYFEAWGDAATSGRFHVMSHPDLVKKFGHRPSFDALPLYVQAADAAARGSVLIEVSSAGLRKPAREIYPGPDLLSCFFRAGVDATIGSDAHCPAEVGRDLECSIGALIAAGYSRAALPLKGSDVRWITL